MEIASSATKIRIGRTMTPGEAKSGKGTKSKSPKIHAEESLVIAKNAELPYQNSSAAKRKSLIEIKGGEVDKKGRIVLGKLKKFVSLDYEFQRKFGLPLYLGHYIRNLERLILCPQCHKWQQERKARTKFGRFGWQTKLIICEDCEMRNCWERKKTIWIRLAEKKIKV